MQIKIKCQDCNHTVISRSPTKKYCNDCLRERKYQRGRVLLTPQCTNCHNVIKNTHDARRKLCGDCLSERIYQRNRRTVKGLKIKKVFTMLSPPRPYMVRSK